MNLNRPSHHNIVLTRFFSRKILTSYIFVCRVNAYIKYGWDKNVHNPYASDVSADSRSSTATASAPSVSYPEQGWMTITTAFSHPSDVPQFNTGHIVAYFVTRIVSDSLPAADLKSVNKSAEILFRCGHVQDIQVCTTKEFVFVKAKCIPEMRKDRVYHLGLVLQSCNMDIVHAECGCPAGKGPYGSCAHSSFIIRPSRFLPARSCI